MFLYSRQTFLLSPSNLPHLDIDRQVDVHSSVLMEVLPIVIVFTFYQRGAIMELGNFSALTSQIPTFSAFITRIATNVLMGISPMILVLGLFLTPVHLHQTIHNKQLAFISLKEKVMVTLRTIHSSSLKDMFILL